MGKNPSSIFRELYSESGRKREKIASYPDAVKPKIFELCEKDHCSYVLYPEVIRTFLKEGYPEKKALKHIQEWEDNDLITIRYVDGYRFIGIYEDVM